MCELDIRYGNAAPWRETTQSTEEEPGVDVPAVTPAADQAPEPVTPREPCPLDQIVRAALGAA